MGRITTVWFDYDGVLTTDRTGSLTTCRYLSQATGIGLERLVAVFGKYNEDLLLGRTTHERIWGSLCRDLGRSLDPERLREAFESTPLNGAMFQLVGQLKPFCKTGIITDNKLDRMRALTRSQNLDAWFDAIIVSAQVGSRKDGEAIFEAAIDTLGVSPGECAFIDNQEKNLTVPRRLGMAAIHHDESLNDLPALTRRLRESGLDWPGA